MKVAACRRMIILGALLVWAGVLHGAARKARGLADYRRIYDDGLSRIETEYLAARLSCQESYLKSLKAVASRMQKAGNLEGWQSATKEQKRFEDRRDMPDEVLVTKPLLLRNQQLGYRESLQRADLARAKQISSFASKYAVTLEKLKKSLTIAGDMTKAIKVKEELSRLAASPKVAEARKKLATAKADEKTAPPGQEKQAAAALPFTLRRGLVLHYSFDKDEDGKVSDKSSKGNDGVVKGAKWMSVEKRGGVYAFDGVDDCITAGDVRSFDFRTGKFSVSAWVKARGTGYRMIACKVHGSRGWGLRLCDAKTPIYFWAMQSRTAYRDARYYATSLMDGKWHHIVGVKAGSGEKDIRVYVDGKDVTSQRTAKGGSPDFDTPAQTLIGGGQNAWFLGTMDDVMIFERGLSASEVRKLFELQK